MTQYGNPGMKYDLVPFLCMFETSTCISDAIYHILFVFNDLRSEVAVRFISIGGFVDHHCLNSLYNHHSILCFTFISSTQ
jgi:hypothetical protein